METKWTPGPWKPDPMFVQVRAEDGQMNVCDIRGWGWLTGQGAMALDEATAESIQRANAHLIAASPDLYEALCDMVSDRYCLSDATVDFAKAALAKARGES